MSQAAELIAEAKAIITKVEKDLKAFEKTSVGGEIITAFTDLGHLNKMISHGREFANVLDRHANPVPIVEPTVVEDTPVLAPQSSETEPAPDAADPAAVPDADDAAPATGDEQGDETPEA